MNNPTKNYAAIHQMLFAHLGLMVIFVGAMLFFVDGRWPYSEGASDDRVTRAAARVSVDGAPAFVPLSPAVLLHKMHDDPLFDVPESVSAFVEPLDNTPQGRVLESYLIWAISTDKSDSYIDILLNSAAAKGDFKIPVALKSLSGRLDTQNLLTSVLLAPQQTRISHRGNSKKRDLPTLKNAYGRSLAYYEELRDLRMIADTNLRETKVAAIAVH